MSVFHKKELLTLKVLVMAIYALGALLKKIITAQWEGMGNLESARYQTQCH